MSTLLIRSATSQSISYPIVFTRLGGLRFWPNPHLKFVKVPRIELATENLLKYEGDGQSDMERREGNSARTDSNYYYTNISYGDRKNSKAWRFSHTVRVQFRGDHFCIRDWLEFLFDRKKTFGIMLLSPSNLCCLRGWFDPCWGGILSRV